jgi:ATP-dependent Clp protease ATP-binding subunit ClpA
MFERFTEAARGVVVDAQEQARSLGHTQVLAEHLLLGVMEDAEGIGARVLRDLGIQRDAVVSQIEVLGDADADALRSLGVDLQAIRKRAEATFGPGALDRPQRRRVGIFRRRAVETGGHLKFSGPAKRTLQQALRAALALKHNYIGSEHILLGLLADEREPATALIRRLGFESSAIREQVLNEVQRSA